MSVNGGPRQWLPAHNLGAGGGTVTVDSGQTLSTLSERAAPPTRKAVAAGTIRIVVMGDSKIEGVGASDREHSWQRKLLATLRATYGSADTGYGYWPAISGHPFVVPNPALAGATATAEPLYGLGMKAVRLGINDTLTYPAQQATKITVFYSRTMFFGGTADVLIDGAVVGSINSAGAEESGRTVSYTVSAGAHTVQIKGTSGSASAVVEGVLFETASSGVKLFDGAHGGYRADLYAQGGADIASYDADDRHYEAVAAANPHLVLIGLGANDMAGVSGGFGVPVNATAFGSYLSTIVTRLRAAAPGCAIVFVMATRRLEDTANPEILTDHEEAAREAIGSLPGVTILYESSLWLPNTVSPQDELGWLADSVHPSDLGHAEIARHVADRLGEDPRLADARTPTAHASAHAAGGSDALTLTAAQLSDLTETVSSAVDAAVPAASPTTPGKIALASTAEATEGADTTKAVTSAGIRAALVAGIASAATLFVSPVTGNDANSGLTAGLAKATIQAAHDALPAAGGRILLAAGETVTVAATTTFTKPVDLEGARATIQATGATFDVIKLTAGASRTRIKGVRFQGGAIVGTTAQFGIFTDAATPATGVHVTECAFVDVNSGIKIAAGCDGWLVSGNEFDHLVGNASGAGYGVLVGAAKRARILANDFTASPGFGRHGVYLSAGADRCIVDGNTLDGFDEAAVSLYALAAQPPNTRCRVTNNVITNSAQSHTADSGSIQVIGANVRCVIAGNTITGSGAYGICVSNASSAGNISFRIAVLNNHVEDSWLSGIIFLSVMHPLALGNYVANSSLGTVNSHSGIRVGGFGTYAGQSASGAKIKGNTVIIGGSERYAIDLNPTAPIPTGTVVDGNIVGAGITDTIQSAGVTATIVYNTTA